MEGEESNLKEAVEVSPRVSPQAFHRGLGVKSLTYPEATDCLPHLCHLKQRPKRQEQTVFNFLFVLKQGLIKLRGIQKKHGKESSLRPDHTLGWKGTGEDHH